MKNNYPIFNLWAGNRSVVNNRNLLILTTFFVLTLALIHPDNALPQTNPNLNWAFGISNPLPGGPVAVYGFKVDNSGNSHVTGVFYGQSRI